MNVGRSGNADPRWLVPLICRRGHVTKSEIGAIRIFDRETKFEVNEAVAKRFQSAISQVEKPEVRIEPLNEAPPSGPAQRHKKKFANKPNFAKQGHPKPHRKGKTKPQ
jgi:ATP-dependent RNA helicase DeaD